jgi:RNA polymerase sigma-70 factor, ECF subfamily
LPRIEAEEAVQEALIRAWTRRHACQSPETPLPWILEITRNESRRMLAHRTRHRDPIGAESVPCELEAEDQDLATATTRVALEQALARLRDADRHVLRLRYGDDLTQADVALRLGIPEGTVKVRLHRARRRLRALLEESS